MCENTLRYRIWYENIRMRAEVAKIEVKIRENPLRWFGHERCCLEGGALDTG